MDEIKSLGVKKRKFIKSADNTITSFEKKVAELYNRYPSNWTKIGHILKIKSSSVRHFYNKWKKKISNISPVGQYNDISLNSNTYHAINEENQFNTTNQSVNEENKFNTTNQLLESTTQINKLINETNQLVNTANQPVESTVQVDESINKSTDITIIHINNHCMYNNTPDTDHEIITDLSVYYKDLIYHANNIRPKDTYIDVSKYLL